MLSRPAIFPHVPALFFLLSLAGCLPPSPPVQSLSEAGQKFLKICQEELKLNVLTRAYPHTLWIYLPAEQRLIDYKSTQDGPTKSKEAAENFVINYLDTYFSAEAFHIEYDIRKSIQYPVSYGYTSIYTDDYQEIQSQILTSLHRSYSGLGIETDKEPGANTERPPDFIVLVAADIKTGIEIVSLFYYEDFKRAMTDPTSMPQDEFAKRNVTELQGQDSIIGDDRGKHVDYHDITWPEFVSKQIRQRVRFKYQHSDFKPTEDIEEEIMTIVAETIKAYNFTDFQTIKLYNLETRTPYKFDRSQLASFHSYFMP